MLNNLIQKAKKENIDIEIFTNYKNQINLTLRNGKVEKTEIYDTTLYKIKAIYNNKTITIYTDIIDIDEIIKNIKEQALIIDNDLKDDFADTNIKKCEIKTCDINITKIINDLKELDKYRLKYKDIYDLTLDFSYNYDKNSLNNENIKLEDSNDYYYLGAEINLEKNKIRKTGSVYTVNRKYDINKFTKKLEEEIDNSISRFKEEDCNTDKYNIILTNECVYKLLNKFAFMFNADDINKLRSPLVNKFKEKIFSSKITIIEDPTNDKLIGKRLFDNEGSATKYKEIVKDGCFNIKLYDKKTAIKDNTISTGNGSGVRNLYLKAGDTCFKDLLKELNNGIVIYNIEGLHAGINTLTGDISLQALGYTVKNGKKDKMLNMILLSTNLFEMFTNVVEVGNDLEFFSITGGAPSILLKDITIVGKE